MTFNRQMYQDALDSQTACNLSGLANALARHTKTIWDESRELGKGTEYVNTHPVAALFLHQMAYLNRAEADLLGSRCRAVQHTCELRAADPNGERRLDLMAHVEDILRDKGLCACSPEIEGACNYCFGIAAQAEEFLGIEDLRSPALTLAEEGYADGGEPYTDEELDIINKGL